MIENIPKNDLFLTCIVYVVCYGGIVCILGYTIGSNLGLDLIDEQKLKTQLVLSIYKILIYLLDLPKDNLIVQYVHDQQVYGKVYGNNKQDDFREILTIRELRQENSLSLAYRTFPSIPYTLVASQGVDDITSIDLTECSIRDLSNLKYFVSLESLVLDKNEFEDLSGCPELRRVVTLWCNNNKISDLKHFLEEIKDKFPSLRYLSMMCNPAVPALDDDDNNNDDSDDNDGVDENDHSTHPHQRQSNNDNNNIFDSSRRSTSKDLSTPKTLSVWNLAKRFAVIKPSPPPLPVSQSTLPEYDPLIDSSSTSDLNTIVSASTAVSQANLIIQTSTQLTIAPNTTPVTTAATNSRNNIDERDRDRDRTVKGLGYSLQEYRYAVIHMLPTLQVLDGIDITEQERQVAIRLDTEIANKVFFKKRDEKDEDDLWKWPDGYIIPKTILDDRIKMNQIKRVQKDLILMRPSYKEDAKRTSWDINKRTIARYWDSNLWREDSRVPSIPKAISDTIDWRLKYPMPLIDRESIFRGIKSGCFMLYGKAKDGRPVMYASFPPVGSRSMNNPFYHQDIVHTALYTFERAVYLHLSLKSSIAARKMAQEVYGSSYEPIQTEENMCQYHDFILVVDTSELSYKHIPPMKLLREVVEGMNKHYKRRTIKIFVLGVGWLAYQAYNMVSYAMSEMTKKKIQFIPNNISKIKSKLLEFIDEDQIPPKYGGSGWLYPKPLHNMSSEVSVEPSTELIEMKEYSEKNMLIDGLEWTEEMVEAYLRQDVYLPLPNDMLSVSKPSELPLYT